MAVLSHENTGAGYRFGNGKVQFIYADTEDFFRLFVCTHWAINSVTQSCFSGRLWKPFTYSRLPFIRSAIWSQNILQIRMYN